MGEFTIEKNEDGIIERAGYMQNGKKNGEWKSFVRGKLVSVINYKRDLLEGNEVWYDRCSGKIIEEGYNLSDKPIGVWYRYSYGELTTIKQYKEDTFEIIYQNPKFKNAGEVPPPPPENYDCYED